MVILLIWLAMYLSFTPVGEMKIAGVQARYYLPLLYLGSLLVESIKMRVQISQVVVPKLTCISACILQAMAIWELAFMDRLVG